MEGIETAWGVGAALLAPPDRDFSRVPDKGERGCRCSWTKATLGAPEVTGQGPGGREGLGSTVAEGKAAGAGAGARKGRVRLPSTWVRVL